jgi:hypothetical protein
MLAWKTRNVQVNALAHMGYAMNTENQRAALETE